MKEFISNILIFTGLIFLPGCGPSYATRVVCGDYAITKISRNYQYSPEQKIVIMPFQATRGSTEPDWGITEIFARKVLELELYTIIDKGVVEGFYQAHGIAGNAPLTKPQLELMKKELGVDLIFYGTVTYRYYPGSRRGSAGAGYYDYDTSSVRAVSTATGKIVVTSKTGYWLPSDSAEEIAYSISKKVTPHDV